MIEKPAKELSLLLQTKIILERPIVDMLARHDVDIIKQFNLISNKKNIFLLNIGPVIDDYNFCLNQDEAFKALAESVKSFADRIRFHLPYLPISRGVEHCSADISNDVVMRIIEYYEIRIDEILTRYDVLIEKIIK